MTLSISLNTRWNRFSWTPFLIEGLEPDQKRRRSDGFAGVEFIQAEDPEIAKSQLEAAITAEEPVTVGPAWKLPWTRGL